MYVCAQLAQPDNAGAQTCLSWVEQSSIVPPMSYDQAAAIGGAFMLAMATAWLFRFLSDFIRRS